ncbi:hypothetical protein F5141DRAFT_1062974 [Pisolithus sp. B1]|nr:hypothetical protein F5141DRAFT_1062974 [Pisolithus sp. B1]
MAPGHVYNVSPMTGPGIHTKPKLRPRKGLQSSRDAHTLDAETYVGSGLGRITLHTLQSSLSPQTPAIFVAIPAVVVVTIGLAISVIFCIASRRQRQQTDAYFLTSLSDGRRRWRRELRHRRQNSPQSEAATSHIQAPASSSVDETSRKRPEPSIIPAGTHTPPFRINSPPPVISASSPSPLPEAETVVKQAECRREKTQLKGEELSTQPRKTGTDNWIRIEGFDSSTPGTRSLHERESASPDGTNWLRFCNPPSTSLSKSTPSAPSANAQTPDALPMNKKNISEAWGLMGWGRRKLSGVVMYTACRGRTSVEGGTVVFFRVLDLGVQSEHE